MSTSVIEEHSDAWSVLSSEGDGLCLSRIEAGQQLQHQYLSGLHWGSLRRTKEYSNLFRQIER